MNHELKEFGLTENEIKIYLALLRLGTANPVQIAEKTGFSRLKTKKIIKQQIQEDSKR